MEVFNGSISLWTENISLLLDPSKKESTLESSHILEKKSEKFERKGKSGDGRYRMENKCTQRVDNGRIVKLLRW